MYNPYDQQASTSDNGYGHGTANPRLVHPQPQHPQQIPNLNNQQFQPKSYQPQAANQAAGFNLFNDPTANLGFQVGQSALQQGQQMMEQNLRPYIGSASDLKNLFKVSNRYVVKKIAVILFPFTHGSWSRLIVHSQGGKTESFELPSSDINSPDLYIPLMAFITYILIGAIFQGLKGDFHPQVFGYSSSIVFGYQLLDFLVLKLGLYLLNVQSSVWDLVSYSNYKFIPLVLLVVLNHFLRSGSHKQLMVYWALFGYLDFAFAFFLMRSLKLVFLSNGINNATQTVTQKQRQKRIYFLFGYAFPFQMILMWLI